MAINSANIIDAAPGIVKGQRVICVNGICFPVGIGGNFLPGAGTGALGIVKVTQYTPYVEAVSGLSQIIVSGMGEDYDSANGTYLVTAETEKESDPFKRIFQHTSGEWFIWGEYEPEYEEGYWYIGPAMDSGLFVCYVTEELTDDTYYFENWDTGDSYDLTLDVTKTTLPEQPMVLKGVMATGYTDGKWSFAETETAFTDFQDEPKLENIYAASGTQLIGKSIAYDGGVPAGTVFLFDKTLTDVVGNIPILNGGLTASSTGVICRGGGDAEISANSLPDTVLCDNKPWTLEIKFRRLDTASLTSTICLFGRGMTPARFDVIVSKNMIQIGGRSIGISADLANTNWYTYKVTHTSSNVLTAYLDGVKYGSETVTSYNIRANTLWIGFDGESRHANDTEIEYIRICNTVEE